MRLHEYRQLQAERTALNDLLAQLPPGSRIERTGLEARRREVEAQLASVAPPVREPVHARLTFNGKPIVGGHGIFAQFGAAAVSCFAEAVAAIGAAENGPLGTRGLIPNREDFRLLITGTAQGSFGFELEEAPRDGEMAFPEDSPLGAAIEQARAVMEATTKSDEELADALSEMDPRALEAVRRFLKTMADQDAVCSLQFREKVFRFADVGQVRRSQERLSQDNIQETTPLLEGSFQGVLPKRRTFEFRTAASQEIIAGKVGAGIPDAKILNRLVDQPTAIRVQVTRVGNGRPRYVLLGIEESPN